MGSKQKNLRLAICWNLLSKYGDFRKISPHKQVTLAYFQTKILCMRLAGFCLSLWCKNSHNMYIYILEIFYLHKRQTKIARCHTPSLLQTQSRIFVPFSSLSLISSNIPQEFRDPSGPNMWFSSFLLLRLFIAHFFSCYCGVWAGV